MASKTPTLPTRPSPESQPATVDAKVAAAYFGVSPELIYRLGRQERIPVYRIGGRAVRFKIDDLEAVFRHESEDAPPRPPAPGRHRGPHAGQRPHDKGNLPPSSARSGATPRRRHPARVSMGDRKRGPP